MYICVTIDSGESGDLDIVKIGKCKLLTKSKPHR